MAFDHDIPEPHRSEPIRLDEYRARRADPDRRYLEAVLAELPDLVARWRREVAAGRAANTSTARLAYARAWGERIRRRHAAGR